MFGEAVIVGIVELAVVVGFGGWRCWPVIVACFFALILEIIGKRLAILNYGLHGCHYDRTTTRTMMGLGQENGRGASNKETGGRYVVLALHLTPGGTLNKEEGKRSVLVPLFRRSTDTRPAAPRSFLVSSPGSPFDRL